LDSALCEAKFVLVLFCFVVVSLSLGLSERGGEGMEGGGILQERSTKEIEKKGDKSPYFRLFSNSFLIPTKKGIFRFKRENRKEEKRRVRLFSPPICLGLTVDCCANI